MQIVLQSIANDLVLISKGIVTEIVSNQLVITLSHMTLVTSCCKIYTDIQECGIENLKVSLKKRLLQDHAGVVNALLAHKSCLVDDKSYTRLHSSPCTALYDNSYTRSESPKQRACSTPNPRNSDQTDLTPDASCRKLCNHVTYKPRQHLHRRTV